MAKRPLVFLRSLVAVLIALALVPAPARADDAPKLAIYSFSVDGAVPADIGAQFADAVASDVRGAGGLTVVRGAPGLAPAQYRADAKAQDADFFLIGAIAAVGTKYSIIGQLVRTRTGLLAFSSTLQASGPDDLRGLAAEMRQVVLDQAGRAAFPKLAVVGPAGPAPQPLPVPSAAPAAPAAPGGAPASAAASTLTAAEAAPARIAPPPPPSTYAVLSFGGNALPSDRAFAVRSVLENIRARGVTAAAQSSVPGDLQALGAQACMDTGAAKIVGGSLQTTRVESMTTPPTTTAAFDVRVYDCRTQTLNVKPLVATKTTAISTDAIRTAVDDVLAAYFGAPLPVPHF